MIIPIILAGGSGTRLWPMSRQLYPKQYLSLTHELTMFQETVHRLEGLPIQKPIVVCNEEHRFLVAEQLRRIGLDGASILLEPEGRNTAPAIALGALHSMRGGDDPVVLVLSADHVIPITDALHQAVHDALTLVSKDRLVTFGIVPRTPETGYGYIQRGNSLGTNGFSVRRFVEKPDYGTATAYLRSGDYLWNSGMFLFRASKYLEELRRLHPLILTSCQEAMDNGHQDLTFFRLNREPFLACPNDSIDYAVMEHTDAAVVLPLDAGWCDVGSWTSLWEISTKDLKGNVCRGDVLTLESKNSLIMSDSRLVATLGVENLIVVETKDAVLVAHKDKAQEIKSLVDALKQKGRSEHISHREVFRPWGSYDCIEIGGRYQVKRISVSPGAKLSVQMHHHRAEHWVVVSGTALVTNGDTTFLVSENQSTYIPLGQVHALENPGKIPLELIEIQSGSYLGEDDIVRFEDQYGRASSSSKTDPAIHATIYNLEETL